MRIELFIGEGWNPFDADEDEEVAFRLDNPDRVDVDASTRNLADLFEKRIRDLYSDADVVVSPYAAGGGRLTTVTLDDPTGETADAALVLDAAELEDDGFDAAEMIAGEVSGQLASLVDLDTHSWRTLLG